MLISLDKCRGYGLFLMRVSYPGCSGPVASGGGLDVGLGGIEVVLIAGKAIDTISVVVAFSVVGELGVLMLVVFWVVEFDAFLIAVMQLVFDVGCFSSRDDR